MQRRNWSPEVRAQALAVYAEHGTAEAARQTGVPVGTVKAWASRGAAVLPRAEQIRRVTDMRKLSAAQRRAHLVDLLAEIADLAATKELELLADAEAAGLHAVVGARTRAIHDMQLLSGDATSRTEHFEGEGKLDRAIEEMLAAMDERDRAAS